MTDQSTQVFGLTLKQWAASFRPGMAEYAASGFTFSQENAQSVRIAFCNQGPYVDDKGNRDPVFNHAITLSPDIAVELACVLLKHYAAPKSK